MMRISPAAKIIFPLLFLAALAGGFFVHKKVAELTPVPPVAKHVPAKEATTSTQPTTTVPDEKPTTPPNPITKIPTMLNLPVPFTPQAPTGNWDELHNEACEEASAIMASAYFTGDTRSVLPPVEVEKQITDLSAWEQAQFGYSLDTTAAETADMIRSVYHLKADIVNDFTEDDIKTALAHHSVVIIPVNGRLIGNPNYRRPGPIYHMLVVRGYTRTQLITNDSGTRRGENYSYDFDTLKNASVDWNHSTNTIDDTKSLMIVVSK